MTDMGAIEAELRQFVIDNFMYGKDGLSNDTSFLASGLIDSSGVLELIIHLEQTYGLEIEDEDLIPENLDSINRLVAFVGRKQAERTGHAA
jgi:acyl carrier protein